VRTTRFWNNIIQMHSKLKIGKPNHFKIFESLGTKKIKGRQNGRRSPMSERG